VRDGEPNFPSSLFAEELLGAAAVPVPNSTAHLVAELPWRRADEKSVAHSYERLVEERSRRHRKPFGIEPNLGAQLFTGCTHSFYGLGEPVEGNVCLRTPLAQVDKRAFAGPPTARQHVHGAQCGYEEVIEGGSESRGLEFHPGTVIRQLRWWARWRTIKEQFRADQQASRVGSVVEPHQLDERCRQLIAGRLHWAVLPPNQRISGQQPGTQVRIRNTQGPFLETFGVSTLEKDQMLEPRDHLFVGDHHCRSTSPQYFKQVGGGGWWAGEVKQGVHRLPLDRLTIAVVIGKKCGDLGQAIKGGRPGPASDGA
jgi:hypothetical protein